MGAGACPAGEACVVIDVVGSQQGEHIETVAQINNGDVSTDYATRAAPGGPVGNSDHITGLAVRTMLIRDVGVAIGSVTYVETTVRNGQAFVLSNADLGEPSDPGYPFPSGLLPAVFSTSAVEVGYIEPLRATRAPNPNQVTAPGGIIHMTVHTSGAILKPVVAASSTKVHAGTTVKFRASFPTPPSTAISYDWDFGEGPDAHGTSATIAHRYTTPGSYLAILTVKGTDGSYGVSRAVVVTVGKPAPTKGTGRGTGTGTTGPTTGPTKSTGTRAGGTASTTPNDSQSKGGTTDNGTTGSGTDAPEGTITGILISTSAASIRPTKPGAEAATAPSARAGGPAGVSWVAVGIAGVAALLGLGVLVESGLVATLWARRRRTP